MPRDVDDGYTRINNEIMEALAATKMTPSEHQCVWYLLRNTYGRQRKDNIISYEQIARATHLPRRSIIRTMDGLKERGIVIGTDNGHKRALSWQFNKYFEKWVDGPSSVNPDTRTPPSSVNPDTTTSVNSDTSLTPSSVNPDTRSSVNPDTLKRKKENSIAVPTPPTYIDDQPYHENYAAALALYQETIRPQINSVDSEELNSMVAQYPMEWIRKGMAIAAAKQKPFLGYVRGCLERMRPEEFPAPVASVLDFAMEDVT